MQFCYSFLYHRIITYPIKVIWIEKLCIYFFIAPYRLCYEVNIVKKQVYFMLNTTEANNISRRQKYIILLPQYV